jgi:hypothetical protein
MSVALDTLNAPGTEDARRMIEQLSALENHDHRVFSLFLTVDPSVPAGRNLRAQLHDVMQPIRTRLGPNSPEYQEVRHAAEEALAAIEQLPGGGMIDSAPLRAFLNQAFHASADGTLPGIAHNLERAVLRS